MSSPTLRVTYGFWAEFNSRLRNAVADLTEEQLAFKPSPAHWPIWAMVGHLACQRVFWLCDFAGEPGMEATPFPNASYHCPGDEDLENVWSAQQLVEALDSTFVIIEHCLDTWTIDMLDEVIRREDFGPDWVHTRGRVIQRGFMHDTFHTAEVWQALGMQGVPLPDLWEWK